MAAPDLEFLTKVARKEADGGLPTGPNGGGPIDSPWQNVVNVQWAEGLAVEFYPKAT